MARLVEFKNGEAEKFSVNPEHVVAVLKGAGLVYIYLNHDEKYLRTTERYEEVLTKLQ